MLVGILKAYKTPTIIDRMAAMNVKELNGSAIFFNIHDVDFENEIIKCKRLVNGVWKSGYSEFPDVVYNDLPQTDATPYKLYRKLESKGIPFTTKRLGISKSEYQRLFDKGSVIQKHLIPTHHIQSAEEVLIYCEQYEKIALKPNYGHKGNGVKFIHTECDDNFTIYHHDKLKNTFNRVEMLNYLRSLLDLQPYHVQKKIESKVNKNGLPLILRSYMGRGLNGRWFNLFNYVAIDYFGSGVVNLNQGAAISQLNEFLKVNYSYEEANKFKENLKTLNFQLVKEFQGNFSFMIDALGMDYAIDDNNNFHIVEINGYPGMRPESGLAIYNMIRFAEYLYKQKIMK